MIESVWYGPKTTQARHPLKHFVILCHELMTFAAAAIYYTNHQRFIDLRIHVMVNSSRLLYDSDAIT